MILEPGKSAPQVFVEMDAELESNKAIDKAQQDQIDSLMASQKFMFVLLIINAVGSLFQIFESLTVWFRLK